MRTALGLAALLAVVVVIVGAGCNSSVGCNACIESVSATFTLACPPNGLTILASGPCSVHDASVQLYSGTPQGSSRLVAVESQAAGICHIELIFSTGFTFATDVTFTAQTAGSCQGCPSYIGPTSGPFTVDNPGDTCVVICDGGADGEGGAAGGSCGGDSGAESGAADAAGGD